MNKKRDWLVTLRKEKGMTQEEVAKIVGISNKHYSAIECGNRSPSGLVGVRLSKLFGFDMELFYTQKVSLKDIKVAKIS